MVEVVLPALLYRGNFANELQHFQFKQWPSCYHGLFFEIEREEIFRYSVDFINNCLRSLGYIIE